MARFGVVLDAAVLVPVSLADTLLRLAERDLYRPLWSSRIMQEVGSALHRVHPDLDASRIEARLGAMNAAFEDACVSGWEPLVDGLALPDPDDRHVVAAAIRGRAELIVTTNMRHFPETALAPLGLTARSPDDFLLDQLDFDPRGTLDLLQEQARDMRRPPAQIDDVVTSLERAGVPMFAAEVRTLIASS